MQEERELTRNMTSNDSRDDDFSFNDDLLLDGADRKRADRLYPAISYALYHDELCQEFVRIDPIANRAKKRSRSSGCWAVALVSFALFLAVSEPLYAKYHEAAMVIAAISGLSGIVGALIGTFGVLYAKQKRTWLQNRLRTERIRLFHFCTMLRLSDLLFAGKREEYIERRAKLFEEFRDDVLDRARHALDQFINEQDADLTPVLPSLSGIDKGAEDQWRDAYRRLRISRQMDFAAYKLRNDGGLLSSFPARQARVLGNFAALCVAGLILTHMGVAGDVFWGVAANIHSKRYEALLTWMHVVGLWFAIVALALRTLQEGLDPDREVERYRHYRAAMQSVKKRFEAAHSVKEAMEAAISAEHASANELLIFLRTGHEARFVM
jgi:hypothetical protein